MKSNDTEYNVSLTQKKIASLQAYKTPSLTIFGKASSKTMSTEVPGDFVDSQYNCEVETTGGVKTTCAAGDISL